MIVAGLDVATQTGVCLGEPGQTPTFWTEDFSHPLHEERGAKALRFANRLIKEHGVQAIGIEAPIKMRHDKTATNELLMGLVFNIRSWAAVQGIPCKTIPIQTIDKRFLGIVQKGGRDARKAAIWKHCQLVGWNPQTQDEADAGSVHWAMCAEVSRSFAIENSPLFRKRVG